MRLARGDLGVTERRVAAVVMLVFCIGGGSLHAQIDDEIPPFHADWLDSLAAAAEPEVQVLVTADGASVMITTVGGADGAVAVRWREAALVEDASFSSGDPWRLLEAGAVCITEQGSVQQTVSFDDGSPDARTPQRRWREVTPDETRDGVERVPAPPTTELHLATVMRGLEWGYGFTFTRPILWNLDAVPAQGPEPLRRATVECSGRETLRHHGRVVACWRLVVESQGRIAPIRAVYWIATEAPYPFERIECDDGRVFERVLERVVEAGASSGESGVGSAVGGSPESPERPGESSTGENPPDPGEKPPTPPDSDRH